MTMSKSKPIPLTKSHPDLIDKSWDFSKNTINPLDVSAGSHKKVWWKCPVSHEHSWEAVVSWKSKNPNSCPFCSGRRICSDTRLDIQFPELAKQWSQKNKKGPENYTTGTKTKVWWICEKGHEWEAMIQTRTRFSSGCPCCSGRIAHSEDNLAIKDPELIEWWSNKNEVKPEEVKYSSHKKVWWKCKKGHEWERSINAMTKSRKCPFCIGRRVSKEKNLLVCFPEIASMWHPTKNKNLTPDQVLPSCSKKVWWKCPKHKDHEWQTIVNYLTSQSPKKRGKCPFCLSRRIVNSNSLHSLYPDLMKEWNQNKNHISPKTIAPLTNKRYWWKCGKCNHEWQASPNNRIRAQSGCPKCYESKGEKYISEILNKKNVYFSREWSHETCKFRRYLKFDFAIFNRKTDKLPYKLIEYHGKQHYKIVKFYGGNDKFELRKKRDRIKIQWCEKNNISLLIIPFTYRNRIEEIIDNFLKNSVPILNLHLEEISKQSEYKSDDESDFIIIESDDEEDFIIEEESDNEF